MSRVSPSRRDRNSMLLEAGMTLASQLSLPAILQRLADLAVELTEARYGALGVLGRDGMLVDFITTGMTEHQRRRRLEALRELAGAILGGSELNVALGLAARRARELVEADLTTIALPGGRPGALVLEVAEGHGAERLRGLEMPIE